MSKVVWDKICECNSIYRPIDCTSPYTSLVGPSGIGKSFCTQSIAAANYAYVIYVSFADHKSATYPGRSDIASWLLERETVQGDAYERARLTVRFECFIASSIRQVEACRRHRISLIDFYKMQVMDKTEY